MAPRSSASPTRLRARWRYIASDMSYHALSRAVPRMTAATKEFPRGTAERRLTDSARMGLHYKPETRVSFFAELLPYMGRGSTCRAGSTATWPGSMERIFLPPSRGYRNCSSRTIRSRRGGRPLRMWPTVACWAARATSPSPASGWTPPATIPKNPAAPRRSDHRIRLGFEGRGGDRRAGQDHLPDADAAGAGAAVAGRRRSNRSRAERSRPDAAASATPTARPRASPAHSH